MYLRCLLVCYRPLARAFRWTSLTAFLASRPDSIGAAQLEPDNHSSLRLRRRKTYLSKGVSLAALF